MLTGGAFFGNVFYYQLGWFSMDYFRRTPRLFDPVGAMSFRSVEPVDTEARVGAASRGATSRANGATELAVFLTRRSEALFASAHTQRGTHLKMPSLAIGRPQMKARSSVFRKRLPLQPEAHAQRPGA